MQKYRAGALEAVGTKTMRWRWGTVDRGPRSLGEGPWKAVLERLPLGKKARGNGKAAVGYGHSSGRRRPESVPEGSYSPGPLQTPAFLRSHAGLLHSLTTIL